MMRRLLGLGVLVAGIAALAPGPSAMGALKIVQTGAPFPHRAFVVSPPAGTQLTTGNVRVFENGQPVADLAVLPAGAAGPKRFGAVMLLDASNSMLGQPIKDALAAARAFAARYEANEPLSIVTFNQSASQLLPLSVSRSALTAALNRTPTLGEGTHIYDAVGYAISLLTRAGINAGSIVLLSDGADTGSSATAADVVARARLAHVRLYSVGLRSHAYQAAPLRDLAQSLGGIYSEAGKSSELAAIFAALGNQLSNQYLVTYLSPAGPKQHVRVSIAVAGLGTVAQDYVTPPLPAYGTSPFHPSFWSRFWRSPLSMVLIALIVGTLVAIGVSTILKRPRSATLRRRMGEFVTIAPTQQVEREPPRLPQAVFAGAEKGFSRTPWWARFQEELEIAEIAMPAVQIVLWTVVGTVVAMWLFSVILGSGLFAIFGLSVPLIVRSLLKRKLNKKRSAFADQLPDNLQVMASALRAGHSFVGALSVVVEEAGEPTKSEFRRVITDEQLGVPLEESLDEVARRMDNIDLEQISLVASLQRRTGSNAAEIIDSVSDTIRARFELRRLARTLTAQGRLSRWVLTGLPVGLLLLTAFLNPGYIHPLLHTGFGHVLLVIAAVMITAGSLVIKKIVEIKV